ncbi:hypothetical protein FQN60_006492 [Etheostoma spectabile]|uniref:Uncharacterized protein n=1 Tax=Etheostoma spectabile TaxID=54343 RepID=A0A5J5CTR0_9PERO|nr:hypothetical protein FQN60_006492 [Etheostoma spectabile]
MNHSNLTMWRNVDSGNLVHLLQLFLQSVRTAEEENPSEAHEDELSFVNVLLFWPLYLNSSVYCRCSKFLSCSFPNVKLEPVTIECHVKSA